MSKKHNSNIFFIPVILAGLLLLSGCAATGDVQNETGYYEVRSNVENASVFFDDAFVGNILKGSLLVPAEISNKPVYHLLMVEAPGYSVYNETVVQAPKPGKNTILRATLTILPPAKTGTVNLAVSPPGGEVFVDGVPSGTVDQSGIFVLRDIDGGYRNVQIKLSGYEDWMERIYVEPNMITKVRVNLTPVTTGSLQVSSEPSAANVLMNGSPIGITPVTIPDLPAGKVRVQLTLPGYQDWSAETSIIPGQTVPVSGSLMPLVVETPVPVNVTPEQTPSPQPTQSPLCILTAAGALGLVFFSRKKR